jgi:hypothetical protein
MPYVGRDGTVGGRKSFTRMITDFLQGVIDLFALFFGSITNPPERIESRSTVRDPFLVIVRNSKSSEEILQSSVALALPLSSHSVRK